MFTILKCWMGLALRIRMARDLSSSAYSPASIGKLHCSVFYSSWRWRNCTPNTQRRFQLSKFSSRGKVQSKQVVSCMCRLRKKCVVVCRCRNWVVFLATCLFKRNSVQLWHWHGKIACAGVELSLWLSWDVIDCSVYAVVRSSTSCGSFSCLLEMWLTALQMRHKLSEAVKPQTARRCHLSYFYCTK